MQYIFIEPLSMVGLFVFFVTFSIVLVYLAFLFLKRARIAMLKRTPIAIITGFPNSGKSVILKELCNNNMEGFDNILNVSYGDIVHDGVVKLKMLGHQGFFSKDGRIDGKSIYDLMKLGPKYLINVLDVSPFSDPIEKQIEFGDFLKNKFKMKRFLVVANKVDGNSKEKLRKIERKFGKKFYKIGLNKPADVNKLRNDLLHLLTHREH